ncbi:MAG TPA: GGDEF domain-containing protein [Gaiellaceae bacterium]|nr:GGDEF domain-containing protein [Gaiellaceae bacterium]
MTTAAAAPGLPKKARALFVSSIGLAIAATVAASLASSWGSPRWADFAVVLVAAAAAQLFAARMGGNQGFHTGLAFTVTAALLFPPELVALVCIGQHIPDWIRHRYRWYIQTFNIANYVLSGMAAWAVRRGLASGGYDATAHMHTSAVVAAACAGAAFVLMNHALLARMLKSARGRDLRSTRLFAPDGLITDIVLAATGILIAFALLHAPALAAVAMLPLLLIHRSLVVPTLREEAYRDHKTGLLNTRGIANVADDELARARRFGRPLSVLVCDVDDLRGINNRYGHVVGDAALVEIAEAFRSELRDYDLCARFGGDEFVIVLPETDLEQALLVADRIQRRLAEHPVRTLDAEVPVGLSIGTAVRTNDDLLLTQLIERADHSMFAAKRSGHEPILTVA